MNDLTPLKIILISLATALTAFIANRSMGIYFNALRPILGDYRDGKISRRELGTLVFGLSIGSVIGSGIPLALATGLMNGPLLFIAGGAIGAMIDSVWIATMVGALWGLGVSLGLHAILSVATKLPVDFLSPLSALGGPLMIAFTFFPVLAIVFQFGRSAGIFALMIALLGRQLTVLYLPRFSPEAAVMLLSIICLFGLAAIQKPKTLNGEGNGIINDAEMEDELFAARGRYLKKNLPFLMLTGGIIATLCYLRLFGKTPVSVFALKEGNIAGAAVADLIDDIGFLPIRVTTIVMTGIYSVMGIGGPSLAYYSPNIFIAFAVGAMAVLVEAMGTLQLGRLLSRLPAISEISKNMVKAMTLAMETGILYGSILVGEKVAQSLGVFLIISLYLLNEASGRPVSRLAAAPLATIIAGVLLNLMALLHLFTPI
jgi:hypothetical protein